MLTMFSITALAATNESGEEQGIISTGELSTDFDQLAPEQIEHFKKVMNGTAGLKTGEVQEVTTFEDGTVLYVTAIDENETSSATRSAQYDTRSFMFYTENWLGQKITESLSQMEKRAQPTFPNLFPLQPDFFKSSSSFSKVLCQNKFSISFL